MNGDLLALRGHLLLALLLLSNGVSQSQAAPNTGDGAQLELSLVPNRVATHTLPRIITLRLRNVSTHDILIPRPRLDCADGMYGALLFQIVIQPAEISTQNSGCFADYSFADTQIDQRIKTWTRLTPSASLAFDKIIPPVPRAPPHGRKTVRTYSFTALYQPPYVSAQDLSILRAAQVYVPRSELKPPMLMYRVK